jgi:hypothetical protein
VLQARSTHDGLQPGANRFGITHRPDMADRRKVRLLNGVFSIRAVSHEAHRGREEAWPVALEQESERGAIATSGGSHQLGICGNRTGEAQEVLHTTMMRAGPKKFDTTIRPNVSEWQLSGRARLLTVA